MGGDYATPFEFFVEAFANGFWFAAAMWFVGMSTGLWKQFLKGW